MRVRSLFLALLVTGGMLQAPPPVALAHAVLVKSEPAADALLKTPPSEVRLWFSEALDRQFSRVSVFDGNRERVDVDQDSVLWLDPGQAALPLKPLTEGTYTVVWSAVSSVDGHRTSGALVFTVGNARGPTGANQSAVGSSAFSGLSLAVPVGANWLSFLSLAALIGVLFYPLPVRPAWSAGQGEASPPMAIYGRRRSRLVWVAAVLYGLATTISFVSRTSSIADLPFWEAIRQPSTFLGVLGTRYGLLSSVRLVLALALFVLLHPWSKPAMASPRSAASSGLASIKEEAALILATMAIVSYAMTGHAAAKGFTLGSDIPVLVDGLHLLALAAWLGGLFLLVAVLLPAGSSSTRDDQVSLVAGFLRRFSPVAALCILVLLGSGVYSATLQAPSVPDLLNSSYGLALAGKLVLIAGMLVAALAVRRAWRRIAPKGAKSWYLVRTRGRTERFVRVRPPGETENELSMDRFTFAARSEAIIAVFVLLAAAVLMEAVPPVQSSLKSAASPASADSWSKIFSTVKLSDSAQAGRLLYQSKGCSKCHGEDARGTEVATFWLAGFAPERVEGAIRAPSPQLQMHTYSREQIGDADLDKIIAFTGELPVPKLVDDLGVFLDASSGKLGPNTFDAYVIAAKNGVPVKDVDRVTIKYANLDLGASATSEFAVSQGDGHYQASVVLGLPGKWQVDVVVRRKGLRDAVASFGFVAAEDGLLSQRLASTAQQLGEFWVSMSVLGVGENEVYLSVNDGEGNPVTDLSDLTLQSLNRETTDSLGPLTAETIGDGRFVVKGRFFSGPGWWVLRLSFRRSEERQQGDFSFFVRGRDVLLQNPYGAHH